MNQINLGSQITRSYANPNSILDEAVNSSRDDYVAAQYAYKKKTAVQGG